MSNEKRKFWFMQGKGKKVVDEKTGELVYPTQEVKLDEKKMAEVLHSEGFRRYNSGEAGENEQPIVHIGTGNIVRFVNNSDIKQWVERYVKALDAENAAEIRLLLQKKANIFSHGMMYDWIGEVSYKDIGLPRNELGKTWFARRNGLVCVTKDSIKLTPHGKEDILLWDTQIIPRDWKPGTDDCVFAQFVKNIAGGTLADFRRAAGYILTDYYDPSTPKAVILNDAMSMDTDISDGRRGKTLWVTVLAAVKDGYCRIDGKSWDPMSKFKFQDADPNTKIIYIDDVKKEFPFESLFSLLANSTWVVEQKNKHPFIIPAGKLVISTNQAISGDDASTTARQFQLEFQPYYSAAYSPDKEFGHKFIHEWGEEEMQALDRYCFGCVQEYLRDGIKDQVISDSLKSRVSLGNMPAVFMEWAESITPGRKERSKWKESFMAYPGIPNGIKNELATKKNLFNDWMRSWAKQKKWTLTEPTVHGTVYFDLSIPDAAQVDMLFMAPELEKIEAQMAVAIMNEEYELAAVLRDKKKKLNGKDNDSQAI